MDENHIDAETEYKISEAERVAEDWKRDAQEAMLREERIEAMQNACAKQVAPNPTAPDSMFTAETPLVYQKEFFGFLLTVTKNSVGILIELHTSVKASAVFGLCCRFLTGLGVPAAQIGGVEPIFSEWLPFPTPEA